jgi:hypothetical protein
MTVSRLADGAIALDGDCPIEDAEPLLQLLLADPDAALDWTSCEQAHTAVLQVVLAATPRLIGPPRGAFLRDHVATALARTGRERANA